MFKKKIFILEKSTRHDISTISVRIKWKNSAYPEQLKPILVALKLFGVMPLTNHKNGHAVFTVFSRITFYSFSILLLLMCLVFYKVYMDSIYFTSDIPDVDIFNYLSRISGVGISLIIFTIPVFWSDMKNIPDYWIRWNIFQNKFESVMRKPLKLNVIKRLWVVTIVPTGLMTINILMGLMFVNAWKLYNSTIFIIVFGIISLSTGYFHINCHVFRNISKDINQRIMEIIVTKGSARKLREHAELWCYMSNLITDFGIVHSGMFCSVGITMYIVSITTLFLFFNTLISQDSYKVSPILMPVVFSNFTLMVFSEAAYTALSEGLCDREINGEVIELYGLRKTLKECDNKLLSSGDTSRTRPPDVRQVGPKLQRKILNLNVYGLGEQTQREVQDFLEIIQLCGTKITFGGFCDINRELFINFLLAVIFNLIVAFQSQIIPNPSVSELYHKNSF